MFWKVEVAFAAKAAEVEARMKSVPVVEAFAPKMMDWVLLPSPEVFVISRFENAEVPVMVPVAVWMLVPFRVVVPVPYVVVPLFV
jgi:hypothetical protein